MLKLKPTEKVVLLMLADTADAFDETYPSNARLAALCNISERTVMRAKQKLEELGLIAQKARYRDGVQLSNNYRLHVSKPVPEALQVRLPKGGDKLSPYRNSKTAAQNQGGDNLTPLNTANSSVGGDTHVTPGVTNQADRGDTGVTRGVTKTAEGGDTHVTQNPLNPHLTHQEPTLQQGKKPSRVSVTGPTWEAYTAEYSARYGAPPERNASVNGKLTQFINRVGAENAPAIAEFFVTLNEHWYIQRMHQVGDLLRDAEKIATQWRTGIVSTRQAAQEQERRQAQRTNFQAAAQKLKERGLWQ
jgi:DNA-binding transcriptional regulator YhcF (GntR family)